jgi:S1-C subfamily serine protease
VLGVNTSGLSRGAALAIPAATVDRVADQLLRDGRVARGYLGLGTQPVRLPPALVARADTPNDVGLMIVSVEAGGPADRAGVMIGDILVRLGDLAVTEPSELLSLLGPDRIGTPITARLVRGGEPLTLDITIGERPAGRGGRGR